MGSFLVTHSKVFTRLAVLWLVLLAAALGFADNSKISPDLQPLLANSANSVNVIVQYNASQGCTIGGLVGDLLCPVVNLLGGVVNVVFTLINGVAGTMSAGDVVA